MMNAPEKSDVNSLFRYFRWNVLLPICGTHQFFFLLDAKIYFASSLLVHVELLLCNVVLVALINSSLSTV